MVHYYQEQILRLWVQAQRFCDSVGIIQHHFRVNSIVISEVNCYSSTVTSSAPWITVPILAKHGIALNSQLSIFLIPKRGFCDCHEQLIVFMQKVLYIWNLGGDCSRLQSLGILYCEVFQRLITGGTICMHIGYMLVVAPGWNTGRYITCVLPGRGYTIGIPGGMPGGMTPVGFWLVTVNGAMDVTGCCGVCDMFIASFVSMASISSSLRRRIASTKSLRVFVWTAACVVSVVSGPVLLSLAFFSLVSGMAVGVLWVPLTCFNQQSLLKQIPFVVELWHIFGWNLSQFARPNVYPLGALLPCCMSFLQGFECSLWHLFPERPCRHVPFL